MNLAGALLNFGLDLDRFWNEPLLQNGLAFVWTGPLSKGKIFLEFTPTLGPSFDAFIFIVYYICLTENYVFILYFLFLFQKFCKESTKKNYHCVTYIAYIYFTEICIENLP